MTNNKSVLIVEDEEILQKAYKAKLEFSGFNVTLASNGRQAFALLKQSKPDLIILDMIMPQMNGIDFLKLIESEAGELQVPIIALSNLDDEENIRTAIKLGVTDYLIKSQISMQDLERKVRETVSAKSS